MRLFTKFILAVGLAFGLAAVLRAEDFKVGDRVQVTNFANVRPDWQGPRRSSWSPSLQSPGDQGVIVKGTTTHDGGFNWWFVNFEKLPATLDGWVIEKCLTKDLSPLPPVTMPKYRDGRAPIAVNINWIDYYASGLMFVDVMKYSSNWMTTNSSWVSTGLNTYNTGFIGQIPLDENGYPLVDIPVIIPGAEATQILHTLTLRSIHGRYPTGIYNLYFDGDGDMDIQWCGKITKKAPGHYEVMVTTGESGLSIKITRSNSQNRIRNIRLIMPGYENTYQTDPFYPPYIEKLKGFVVLRFMDTGNTNSSTLEHWSDRAKPSYFTQGTSSGCAYEYMVQLANKVGADPWLCIPHMADDNYIREMARVVKANLDPRRVVYLEYSNEVWNTGPGFFPQTNYVEQQGKLLYGANAPDPLFMYYAKRAADIFRIFSEEMGSAQVYGVLASQAANSDLGGRIMKWFNDPMINPTGVKAHAFAPATYFGPNISTTNVDAVTVDDLINGTRDYIPTIGLKIGHNKANAFEYGLPVITYEGGESIAPPQSLRGNQVLVDKTYAAARDPRITGIYMEAAKTLWASGGELFNQYNYIDSWSKYGTWSALEYTDQLESESPKYRALRLLINFMGDAPMLTEQNVGGEKLFMTFKNIFNPAKGETLDIFYVLPQSSHVTLTVLNQRGQKIQDLDNEDKPADVNHMSWDGRNSQGSIVASGVYILRLQTGDKKETKKVVVIK